MLGLDEDSTPPVGDALAELKLATEELDIEINGDAVVELEPAAIAVLMLGMTDEVGLLMLDMPRLADDVEIVPDGTGELNGPDEDAKLDMLVSEEPSTERVELELEIAVVVPAVDEATC